MSDDDGRSLADGPTEPRDVTEPLDAKTFDLAAFAAGIRPARRAVRIYARRDLEAALDVLDEDIKAATDLRDNVRAKELRAAREDVVREMQDAALDIVVEARSDEARAKLADALTADGLDDEGERLVRLVHAQIIEPDGFTADLLRQIRESLPGQFAKIVAAAAEANTDGSPVTPDFSRGRSATTRK